MLSSFHIVLVSIAVQEELAIARLLLLHFSRIFPRPSIILPRPYHVLSPRGSICMHTYYLHPVILSMVLNVLYRLVLVLEIKTMVETIAHAQRRMRGSSLVREAVM